MGKTPVNAALGSLSGRIDDFVYRQLEGRTIVARRAREREVPLPLTAAQVAVRERFRRAADYARAVFADPPRKQAAQALAARRGFSAARLFAFLVQDYARPLAITELDPAGYTRQIGDRVKVYAQDEGEVVGVRVALKAADGTVLETGAAMKVDAAWVYTATTTVPPGDPVTIEATAEDRPGNRTVRTAVIP